MLQKNNTDEVRCSGGFKEGGRGGGRPPPIDCMHLKSGEKFAQKMHRF